MGSTELLVTPLGEGGVALIAAFAFAFKAIFFDTPQCEIWPPFSPKLK
jgi:hypothetical protein